MKIVSILLLYDALISGETVSRTAFCKEHIITERTFYRYMKEVTDYLRVFKAEYALDDTCTKGTYRIKKT